MKSINMQTQSNNSVRIGDNLSNVSTVTTASNTTNWHVAGIQSDLWSVTFPSYNPMYKYPDVFAPDLNYPQQNIKEKIIIKEKEEDKKPMKKLFRVYVITLDEEIILDGKLVVSEDVKDAEFSAEVFTKLKEKKLKPKDVTVICESLGDVKVREEIQQVQIVDKK